MHLNELCHGVFRGAPNAPLNGGAAAKRLRVGFKGRDSP